MYTLQATYDKQAPDGTSYNDFPIGWREIPQKEAVRRFFRYHPDMIESRQMLPKRADGSLDYMKAATDATLHWFSDGTGFGMVGDYDSGCIRFFVFGCEHDYRGMSQQECHERGIYHGGRCYSVSECTKCGHVKAVDSSD